MNRSLKNICTSLPAYLTVAFCASLAVDAQSHPADKMNDSISKTMDKFQDVFQELSRIRKLNKRARTDYLKILVDTYGGSYKLGSEMTNRGELLSIKLDFSKSFHYESRHTDEVKSKITGYFLELLHDASELRILELKNAQVSDKALSSVAHLNKVHWLDLEDNPITDEGLKHLQKLTNLRLLKLGHTKITGNGFKHLSGCVDLETFGLNGTQVKSSTLNHLSQLPNLSYIDLRSTQIDDQCGKFLASLKQLRNIDLSSNNLTESVLRELVKLPKIESINASSTNIFGFGQDYHKFKSQHPRCKITNGLQTDSFSERVSQLKAIHRIKELGGWILFNSQANCANKNNFGIKWIYLSDTRCSNSDLALVASLSNTKHLFLRNTDITNGGSISLAKISGLLYLNLKNTPFCDSGIDHLSLNLPNLEVIDATHTCAHMNYSLPPKRIKIIGKKEFQETQKVVNALKDLGCTVSYGQTPAKVSPRHLSELHDKLYRDGPKNFSVQFTRAKDINRGITLLNRLHRLESVSLSATKCNDNDIELLLEQLSPDKNGGKKLPYLKSVDLNFTKVSDQAAKKLQKALPDVFVSHRFRFKNWKTQDGKKNSTTNGKPKKSISGFRFSQPGYRYPKR